jgi:hypothetical protein
MPIGRIGNSSSDDGWHALCKVDERGIAMLEMPRRSVTRFFIPLIDVLTLLFCVFLVMPLAKSSNEDAGPSDADEVKKLHAELDRLRGLGAYEPEKMRRELEDLRKAKVDAIQDRIMPYIIEINNEDGELYVQRSDGPTKVDRDEAQRMIQEDKGKYGDKAAIVYVLQYPRQRPRKHPTFADLDRYKEWFTGAALKSEATHGRGP